MEPRGRLATGNVHVEVMGYKIRKVGKGQTALCTVLRTLHFILKARGSQGKIISRGLIGFVV